MYELICECNIKKVSDDGGGGCTRVGVPLCARPCASNTEWTGLTDASVDHPVDETATFANSISFTNSPVKKEKEDSIKKKV